MATPRVQPLYLRVALSDDMRLLALDPAGTENQQYALERRRTDRPKEWEAVSIMPVLLARKFADRFFGPISRDSVKPYFPPHSDAGLHTGSQVR